MQSDSFNCSHHSLTRMLSLFSFLSIAGGKHFSFHICRTHCSNCIHSAHKTVFYVIRNDNTRRLLTHTHKPTSPPYMNMNAHRIERIKQMQVGVLICIWVFNSTYYYNICSINSNSSRNLSFPPNIVTKTTAAFAHRGLSILHTHTHLRLLILNVHNTKYNNMLTEHWATENFQSLCLLNLLPLYYYYCAYILELQLRMFFLLLKIDRPPLCMCVFPIVLCSLLYSVLCSTPCVQHP